MRDLERRISVAPMMDCQIISCDAVNRSQEFMVAKRLVACRAVIDPLLLADESVQLKNLAANVEQGSPK